MKTLLRFLLRLLFGFRAYNEEVLKTPGPVLLLPNHVSWLDWLFLLVCTDKDWKCVVSERTAHTSWLHRKIMINRRTFPIDTDSPYAVKHMAEFLAKGGRLTLFPEGRLSRTGTLMKLFDGTGFLLHKTGAKVITCYLRGAHRLPASPNPNRKKCFPRITAHFSDALIAPPVEHLSTSQARALFTNWLRDQMVRQQFEIEMQFGPQTLAEAVVEPATRFPGHVVLQDVNAALTYKKLLVSADLMARQLDNALSRDVKRVGVLLPNVNATPVVLLSLWTLDKEAAIFNYSTGPAIMLSCAQLAAVKQIITSRAFLERAKLDVSALSEAGIDFVYLEDIRARISGSAKLRALLKQTFSAGLPCARVDTNSAAIVLFTSGSEGVPKGVELTHRNILANVRQMLAVTDLTDNDRIFNAMPLFHSFALTVGTLLPLVRGMSVFIYPSPLHYRVVPTVFYDTDCTIMLGTNTSLNGYARKANPYDFRSLRYMFAAAEKLQETTATTWAQRFGVRVLEGYGATECAACVSGNTPLQAKYGSAGRLMPGMEYKLERVEGVAEGGRLFVRGPNVMKGYLNADANAKFQSLGGWYDTGDIVRVDQEGYVFIQGRLKRFAKISGEMVSLTAVEDALAGAFPHYGLRCQAAVVSRPDEDKGEKLIAISNEAKLTLDEVRAAIKAKGLPNIAVPREVKFIHEIPKLGTGKVNYRELDKMI
ncbi:AMP-binding protein [Sulfuricella sp.]|uniref:AMP-binding protein n=1 Tax=Sulfuricella sp. TaxID=2099377 RepID=UPI002C3AEC6D|nr:AMP-binding protein [Sulfuricella sp.]HUX64634.1 AMP-binding protein [Sulfuricella sp.]